MYRNKKRNKYISDKYTNKIRISRVAAQATFKKNCHGGCAMYITTSHI